MECAAIRSSSPIAFIRPWPLGNHRHQKQADGHQPLTSPDSSSEYPLSFDQHQFSAASMVFPQSTPPNSPFYCSSPLGFCRRAASFPLASAALQQTAANLVLATSAPPQQPHMLFGPPLKVRSQSESAALNKLTQMSINRMPRSLLDEFQNHLSHHLLTGYKYDNHRQKTNGFNTATATQQTGPNGRREVKFYAQQPPLQSDSEGEDSLVSSPDEASPSNSCNEEEPEEGEFACNGFLISPASSLIADNDTYEEDLGLGPMDEEIEQDRDRLCAAKSSSITVDDYMTVPPLSASLDVAPQPSPMIQLPLQLPLPLANIVDLNSIHPNESNKLDQEREIDTIKAKDDMETDQEIIPMSRPCSKKRQTKCVRFADDCGRCLETVRVMTEPSDYPPKISPAVLKRYRRAAALAARKDGQQLIGHAVDDDSDELDSDDCDRGPRSTWKLGFKQPASEYVKFRETLDHQKVALENVMLKNEQCRMVGTIKVANIAFEKVVFVRYSADKWRTFVDKLAQYQSSPSKTFDTFRFDIEIPRNEGKDARLEFCICFRAGTEGVEYWDSCNGRNFVLLTPEPPLDFGGAGERQKTSASGTPMRTEKNQLKQPQDQDNRSQPRRIQTQLDRDDPYRMEWNSPTGWNSTTFASWRQLSNGGPYWSSCTAPLTPPIIFPNASPLNLNDINNSGRSKFYWSAFNG